MISLVTKAADEARQRSSKRVLGVHLKQAVMKEESFDFLHDIVSKVQDAPSSGARASRAAEADSDEEEGKKKRGGGRRKKKDSDEF
jgi:hypothetical protein